MIHFKWFDFSELDCTKLYELLRLRAEIFVVDQNCVYQDLDNKDFEAKHLLGCEQDALQSYARLFPPNNTSAHVIFGRVLTAKSARNKGYAKKLLSEILAFSELHYPKTSIECSAQFYLKKFYESFGFKTVGEIYNEDGIPHIKMILNKTANDGSS